MAGQPRLFCRQYSTRPASLETNSWKSTIRFSAHTPPGLRKSGTPDSVEMPAPVKPTTREAPATSRRAASTAVSGVFPPRIVRSMAPALNGLATVIIARGLWIVPTFLLLP